MATRSGPILLTYEDYLELPNDRNRYEILEGDLAVDPAPSPAHQTVVLNVGALLRDHVRRFSLGRVFIAPTDVLLSDTTIVQPDIRFISRERETGYSQVGLASGNESFSAPPFQDLAIRLAEIWD